MCDMAHFAGLVAAGLHPNPVPYCDIVTSTTHKTLAGPRAGFILCREEHAAGGRQGGLPRHAGRPADAHDRRQGGLLPDRRVGAVPRLPAAGARERRRARRGAASAGGLDVLTGGTDTHLLLLDLRDDRVDGQGRRGAAARRAR